MPVPLPTRPWIQLLSFSSFAALRINGERRSTGIGKTIVEFCSIPISVRVER
jgi:hypothetical protein